MEYDYYGREIGSRLDTILYTSIGPVELLLRRVLLNNELVIEADLFQGDGFLDSQITKFRCVVYMRWDGQQYKIFQPTRYINANKFWKEMEVLIANTIIINE